jgi:hypothetical protein
VPDCRSRKLMVLVNDELRIIDHDKEPPQSEAIDAKQITWLRDILENWMPAFAGMTIINPSTLPG